jgi:hypothetical protein
LLLLSRRGLMGAPFQLLSIGAGAPKPSHRRPWPQKTPSEPGVVNLLTIIMTSLKPLRNT